LIIIKVVYIYIYYRLYSVHTHKIWWIWRFNNFEWSTIECVYYKCIILYYVQLITYIVCGTGSWCVYMFYFSMNSPKDTSYTFDLRPLRFISTLDWCIYFERLFVFWLFYRCFRSVLKTTYLLLMQLDRCLSYNFSRAFG